MKGCVNGKCGNRCDVDSPREDTCSSEAHEVPLQTWIISGVSVVVTLSVFALIMVFIVRKVLSKKKYVDVKSSKTDNTVLAYAEINESPMDTSFVSVSVQTTQDSKKQNSSNYLHPVSEL